MQANEHWESDEEFLARLAKLRAQRKAEKLAAQEAAKPKLVLPVSEETAERARARPESVRISTVRDDAIPVLERVRVREIVHPLEVDEAGRVSRARHVDCATGEVSIREYHNGYQASAGAQHEYNPLDGLRRPEDE
jgi:hypothetical protein